ncbi:hypothetical protein Tco_1195549 [Tanacetum coccineum]
MLCVKHIALVHLLAACDHEIQTLSVEPQEGKEVPILHEFHIGSNYLDIEFDELFPLSLVDLETVALCAWYLNRDCRDNGRGKKEKKKEARKGGKRGKRKRKEKKKEKGKEKERKKNKMKEEWKKKGGGGIDKRKEKDKEEGKRRKERGKREMLKFQGMVADCDVSFGIIPNQQSQLCKQPQEGKEVPILHEFHIGSNYLDIEFDEFFPLSLVDPKTVALCPGIISCIWDNG